MPKVFTEQGIYMLMTILKGELAERQSIALVRVFKQMKDFILDCNQTSVTLDEFRREMSIVIQEIATPSLERSPGCYC